jgi:hypothetical protein
MTDKDHNFHFALNTAYKHVQKGNINMLMADLIINIDDCHKTLNLEQIIGKNDVDKSNVNGERFVEFC